MPSSETKVCQNCKASFIIDAQDFQFYEKMKVPPPTWCPECRMKRRMIWRNYRYLFRNRDAISGKEIFSTFPAAVPAKVYELDYWNSDAWDSTEYGREYDFSKTFFAQFKALLYEVPWPSKAVIRLVNSDYCNQAGGFKNCYLCFNADDFENSGYCTTGVLALDSFDLHEVRHTELSYDGYMIDESFRVFYSVNIEECTDVWFSRNLFGCTNCFGCVNLRKKSYYIFNEPYSREAYLEFMAKFHSGSHAAVEEMKTKAHEHWKKFPMKYALLINVTNATGEHIERSKNVKLSYGVHEGENIAYSQDLGPPVSDSYDYTSWGHGASRIYESIVTGEECDSMKFSWDCWPSSHNVEYSVSCRSSSNLFGCVALQKKQYCIFNKQYSKEEYVALREKIIAHMNSMPYVLQRANSKEQIAYKYGEFFPSELSPFAYNETLTQDLFPLTKAQAEAQGYLWREPETRAYSITVQARDLPDTIGETPDTITKEVLGCVECGKPYRVIPMEFDFLRRIPLPIPRECPECRFHERFAFANKPQFRAGKCQCVGAKSEARSTKSEIESAYTNGVQHFHGNDACPNEFQTSYPPDSDAIIYCEKCYQAETA